MKKYIVNVNGNRYEITLEVVEDGDVAAAPAPKTETAAPATGQKITAPMPGNILSVNVANGTAVKKGQVLAILEAMKMENEIMAPADGTVTTVHVTKGATVETGALLFTLA